MHGDVGDFGVHALHFFGQCELLRLLLGSESIVKVLYSCCGGEKEIRGTDPGELKETFDDLLRLEELCEMFQGPRQNLLPASRSCL